MDLMLAALADFGALMAHIADANANADIMLAGINAECDAQHIMMQQMMYGVNHREADGKTLLHLAVQTGRDGVVDTLLASDADKDATDRDGRTPLHCACDVNVSEAVVRSLVRAGANVEALTPQGETPGELLGDGHDELRHLLHRVAKRRRWLWMAMLRNRITKETDGGGRPTTLRRSSRLQGVGVELTKATRAATYVVRDAPDLVFATIFSFLCV